MDPEDGAHVIIMIHTNAETTGAFMKSTPGMTPVRPT